MEKNIVNDLYHAAVVGGLTIGYAKICNAIFKVSLPTLDFNPKDIGLVVLDVTAAMYMKDMLIKQGIIPDNIVK